MNNLTDICKVLWDSFRDIWFVEDGHMYTDSEGHRYTSVTSVIGKFHPKFDAEKIAPFTAAKMSKELGREVTTQEVLDMWKDKNEYSKEFGTNAHLIMENIWQHKDYQHTFTNSYKIDDINADFARRKVAIQNLYKKLSERYIPVKNELLVYDKESMLCGGIDFLAYDTKADELVIMDWKTNFKIDSQPEKYTKMMYAPFGNFYDLNLYHYYLQLSLYKAILEKSTGLHVGKMWIFHITPKCEVNPYKVIDVSDVCKKELLNGLFYKKSFG